MAARHILGADQVAVFKNRYCKVATADEIAAAGFDAEEDEEFYRLDVVPSHVFRIPGFSTVYNIQSQWQKNQIIHPWWL